MIFGTLSGRSRRPNTPTSENSGPQCRRVRGDLDLRGQQSEVPRRPSKGPTSGGTFLVHRCPPAPQPRSSAHAVHDEHHRHARRSSTTRTVSVCASWSRRPSDNVGWSAGPPPLAWRRIGGGDMLRSGRGAGVNPRRALPRPSSTHVSSPNPRWARWFGTCDLMPNWRTENAKSPHAHLPMALGAGRRARAKAGRADDECLTEYDARDRD